MTPVRLLNFALMLAPAAAMARPAASFDVFYIPSAESEVSNPIYLSQADGDGYGIRGRFQPTLRLFLQGEAQSNTYASDVSDIKGTAVRLGAGTPLFIRKRFSLYGLAEVLRVDFVDRRSDSDVINEDGLGLHLGAAIAPLDAVRLYAQAGVLKLEDSDGREFQGGIAAKFDPRVGGFLEYRRSEVDSIKGIGTPERVNYEFSEVRVGVRFSFGRQD